MNEEGLSELLSKAAVLVAMFDHRCEQASQDLKMLAQQIPDTVRHSADEQLGRLQSELIGRVSSGIERPVSACEQRLQDASTQLQHASQTLAGQLQRAETIHRHLILKVAVITLGSLILLLIGGTWMSRHYYDEIRSNQISAELLNAYNQADVNLCDGRLCVRVDANATAHGDYVPVAPR